MSISNQSNFYGLSIKTRELKEITLSSHSSSRRMKNIQRLIYARYASTRYSIIWFSNQTFLLIGCTTSC